VKLSFTRTLRQEGGPDSYTFELRNFQCRGRSISYPSGHFPHCNLLRAHRTPATATPMHNALGMQIASWWKTGYLLLTTPKYREDARAIRGVARGMHALSVSLNIT
jgi:hypothetical protein